MVAIELTPEQRLHRESLLVRLRFAEQNYIRTCKSVSASVNEMKEAREALQQRLDELNRYDQRNS